MPRKRRDIPWLEWRNGTAYVHWYDAKAGRTERLSLRTADAVEAQKRYAAFLTQGPEIFDGNGGRSTGLTVTQGLDDYWREHVSVKVIDKRRTEVIIGHLKDWFKDTPFLEIDIPACRAYATARRTGAVGGGKIRNVNPEGADSTIRRELGTLQAAANHAARWRRIGPTANPPTPMPSIELTSGKTEEAPWLTKEELKLVIDTAEGDLKDFIIIAYRSAGRRNSIERLSRPQVDLRNSRLNLTSPEESELERQSKKRRPIVPIDNVMRPSIERLMQRNDNLLFRGRTFYYAFVQLLTSLGLADRSNPHILRHSRATHLLQDGVDIYVVAKLLGDTVATVERVYGHHCPNHLADVIEEKRA